jgi:HEPN domain-containing protein
MNNNEREALRWYLQGAKDSKTAEKNARGGDFEISCFLFQQAAEKVLKAYLFLQGERVPFGHSTYKLARSCERYDQSYSTLRRPSAELDVLYIPTRYPYALPEGTPYEFFTLEQAQKAADDFQEVYRLVYQSFEHLVQHVG